MAPSRRPEKKVLPEPEVPTINQEIARLEEVRVSLLERIAQRDKNVSDLVAENKLLKQSLELSNLKIRELDGALNAHTAPDGQKEGYVEVVAVFPGEKQPTPAPIKVDGIIVPSRTDEDGFYHWILPVKVASRMFVDTSATKFLLVGPVDTVECEKQVGPYTEKVKALRHKKIKNGTIVRWIPVEVVESE